MDESERIAKRMLEDEEGHVLLRESDHQPIDFFCTKCDKSYEIKSVGRNNEKIGFRFSQIKQISNAGSTVIVIDRRSKRKVLQFKITECEAWD